MIAGERIYSESKIVEISCVLYKLDKMSRNYCLDENAKKMDAGAAFLG
jgi:hypothetical protein